MKTGMMMNGKMHDELIRGGRTDVPKTHCPNCDSIIKANKLREGAILDCPECGVELEVISVDPFEVDFTDDWQDAL